MSLIKSKRAAVIAAIAVAITLIATIAIAAIPIAHIGRGVDDTVLHPVDPREPHGITVDGLDDPNRWQIEFQDEFNGNAVDTRKWNVADNSNYGSGNHEDQCYKKRNVSVSDGTLKIKVKRETNKCDRNNPDTGNKTYYFTSGMLTTRAMFGGGVKFKGDHGYYEASIKNPKGNAFWNGFWLVSPNDGSTPGWPQYGEFDISEVIGIRPDNTFGTFHFGCTESSRHNHCQSSPNNYNIKEKSANGSRSNVGTELTKANFNSFDGETSKRFVKYGLLWEQDMLVWLVDRKPVRYLDANSGQLVRIEQDGSETVEKTYKNFNPDLLQVLAYDHSFILNQAFGGAMPRYWGYTGKEGRNGYNNGNLVGRTPAQVEFDYVRFYKIAHNVPAPPPDDSKLVVQASADVFVKQREPDKKFAGWEQLRTSSAASAKGQQDMLLKFDVANIGRRTVESAKLHLVNADASPDGGSLYEIPSSGWDLATATWNNVPSIPDGAKPVARIGAVKPGPLDVDLTNVIDQDGRYSFRVTSNSTDEAWFWSSRKANQRPVLEITFGEAVPAPPPESPVITLPVTEDTFVDRTKPTKKFGGWEQTRTASNPKQDMLYKVDVKGIGRKTVESAELVLQNADPSPDGGAFYPLSDTSWKASEVTWDTAPAIPAGTRPTTSLGRVDSGEVTVDLTSAIQRDGAYAFRATSKSRDSAWYWSSRRTDKEPELRITLSDDVQPTATVTHAQRIGSQAADRDLSRLRMAVTTTRRSDSLIQFDVRDLPPGGAPVKLVLDSLRAGNDGGELYRVSDSGWSDGMTWNNAPQIKSGATPAVRVGKVTTGKFEIDLSSVVDRDGVYSFRWVGTDSQAYIYDSLKRGTSPPTVVFE